MIDAVEKFVKDIFVRAGIEIDVSDQSDIFGLDNLLKENISNLDDYYSEHEDDVDHFSTVASEMISELKSISEIWKYLLIYQTLEEVFINFDESLSTLREHYYNAAGSPDEVFGKFSAAVEDAQLPNDDEVSQSDIDFMIGWFCFAVEVSINDGDEDELTKWITGFGNCAEYDNDVSDIISKLGFEFRDWLLEDYMKLLNQYYQIDTFDEDGEFRSEDEGVDWDAVSEEFSHLL